MMNLIFEYMDSDMPNDPERIAYEYFAFRLVHDKSLSQQQRYDLFKSIASLKTSEPQVAINYFILTLNENYHDGSFEPDYNLMNMIGINDDHMDNSRLKHFIDLLDERETEFCLDELKAYYHTRFLTNRYHENPFDNFSKFRTHVSFLSGYFSNTLIHEDIRYQAVLFFNLLKLNSVGFPILESIYMEGTENREYIRHYVVAAINESDYDYSIRYQRLMEAKELLSRDEWCELFYKDPSLSYNILDLELFRNLFCINCGCY